MSFIASRSVARAASRSIARAGPRAPLCSSRLAQHHALKSSSSLLQQRLNTARTFSTTMVQASAGDAFASPAPPAQYDQEIVDMASYIHNYNIDSELAVRCDDFFLIDSLLTHHPPDRYRSLRLPRHPRLRSQGPRIPPLHQAARSRRRGHHRPQWHKSSRHTLPA